jgi:hypothetical protein
MSSASSGNATDTSLGSSDGFGGEIYAASSDPRDSAVLGTPRPILEASRLITATFLASLPPIAVTQAVPPTSVMTAAGGDVPHRFHNAAAYGDVLIPAVHHDVLLAAVEQESVAYREGRRAVGAQDDLLGMQGLNADAGHALHLGEYPPW